MYLSEIGSVAEMAATIRRIDVEQDIFICLSDNDRQSEQIAELLIKIANVFPDAATIYTDGRGGPTGAFFKLLEEVNEVPYRAVLFLHDNHDATTRRAILRALTSSVAEFVDLVSADSDEPMGIIGRKLFPYDYRYLDSYQNLISKLNISVRADWSQLLMRYPELEEMEVLARTRWAVARKIIVGRPELDIEYAESQLGDYTKDLNPSNLQDTQRRLIAHGVMGPLPWFSDLCFWLNPLLIRRLARQISLAAEYQALPNNSNTWFSNHARAPAWNRVLPVFAIKNKFLVAEIE